MNDTYVEISLDNIHHNIDVIKERYKEYDKIIAVLKSDAYGHGEYIVNELVKSGVDYVAVATIKEALDVRKFNKTVPVLLLEPIKINDLDICLENKLTITISTLDFIMELNQILNKKINVHIKVDSGMGRIGFTDKNKIKEAYDILNSNKYITVEGIYSHFGTLGIFDKKWDIQLENFKELTSMIDINKIPIRHMGSSTTLVNHPKIDFCNAIRIGTLIYGHNIGYSIGTTGLKNRLRLLRNRYYQKKYNISKTFRNVKLDLKPCMNFYTNIIEIKHFKKGDRISYNDRIEINEDSIMAIIPVGYNNGLGQKSFGRFVVINNKKYPVLAGCMNMSFVKIDDTVSINDKVSILDNINISATTLGNFTNRTFQEMLLNIGKSNIRKYIKDGKVEYIDYN